MEKILDEVEFLVGDKPDNLKELFNLQSFETFSSEMADFLIELSGVLLNDEKTRQFPDVATFAFYCRSANISYLKRTYIKDAEIRLGRGIVFHITPGNVPVNFAYSLFAGLIMGNINIVKVPSKSFQQVDIIVEAIKKVIKQKKFESIFSKRLYVVRYSRDSQATSYFSKICDVRVIWGGDQTIDDVRRNPIPPKSTEITFSDRYSISVISAAEYLKSDNKLKIAQGFYNDTYLFDQNACTSPQTIYWLGNEIEIESAQNIFWDTMENILQEKKFQLDPILSVDKLTTFYSQAVLYDDISKKGNSSNEIWRVNNKTINKDIELHKCSSGYFNEINISTLDEIAPVVNRKYQTVAYFGVDTEELKIWIKKCKLIGIDRVVPIGRTMDFSLIWDGYDLVSYLSRQIQIL